jgi:hypothetical protein
MNSLNKALAAGVTLALASVSAHAQLGAPAINEGSAPSPNGLYLAVFDTATQASEVVNLGSTPADNLFTGYNYANLTTASGNLTPTAPNSAFSLATDPAGSGSQVLQLNFGQVAGFTAAGGNIFTGAQLANTSYMVLSARTGTGQGMEVTNDGGAPIVTAASLGGGQQNINSEIASWVSAAPTTGDLIDTTGTATYSVTNGVLQSGAVIAGSNYSNSVGSSLGFYNIVSTGRSSVSINQYKNSAGAGYWFLSNTGDLTYNIAAAAAPVPLPAAVWLLGSGLLGMAGIARRRSVA